MTLKLSCLIDTTWSSEISQIILNGGNEATKNSALHFENSEVVILSSACLSKVKLDFYPGAVQQCI